MSKSTLAKRRAVLQQWIWKYHNNRKVTATNLVSIHRWTKEMDEIDKITNQMIAISNAVILFAGRSPRRIGKGNKHDQDIIRLAKSLFYKYGLESGINGTYLAEFAGIYKKNEAFQYRTKFTQSFKDKTSNNKQRWYMFKEHIDRLTAKGNFIDNQKTS